MLDVVNLARTAERSRVVLRPGFQRLVSRAAVQAVEERLSALRMDPERRPDPNACTLAAACVGDPRLNSFGTNPDAIVRPALFTARSGATLSGHLWAMRNGPARKPLVVIVNGSLIDFEQGHWPQAQSLAKAGYVVLTFDPQGEGMSDQFGEGRDRLDSVGAGLPGLPDNGRPFYDGAADALDFALSRPGHRYVPAPSSGSDLSHAAKQRRRVAAGLNAPFNPLWRMVDRSAVGLTGYSYGAVAASYVAQADRRVSAVVAWDSLCYPVQPSTDEVRGLFFSNATSLLPGITAPLAAQIPRDCFGAAPGRQPRPHAAALGISGDFVLPGLVQSTQPGAKAAASKRYSRRGVDSGQIVIQGATHADFVFDASVAVLPARLRGLDLTIWYTLAWFDKYLKHERSADRRLLTRRWQSDAASAAVDPVGDGNLISQLFDSRFDIHVNGRRWVCEDVRIGCQGMRANDGRGHFDYVDFVTARPDN